MDPETTSFLDGILPILSWTLSIQRSWNELVYPENHMVVPVAAMTIVSIVGGGVCNPSTNLEQ